MKKTNKLYLLLTLTFISVNVFAQENIILCKDNYYLETAVSELNTSLAQMSNYSVSAPTNTVGPNGHHTICVTLTKLN